MKGLNSDFELAQAATAQKIVIGIIGGDER